MTDEKWEQLVEIAKTNFRGVKLHTEDLIVETQDGPQKEGTQDVLEFDNPAGKFQIIRENRPLVIGKKTMYTHRPGDTAHTEYQHSKTEQSHRIRVFKELGFDDWEEVTLDKLGL